MTGYAPLFSSLSTGTLCGRWPDIGLWPIVLSLTDRRGILDVTPDYLARITGLPISEVTACMARFCEPDPHSRTAAEEGRRLLLLDPEHRNWGWRVVNHGIYRERARKQQWDIERTASGRNAERMRVNRERSETANACRDVPTGADATRDVLMRSDGARSQTQTQTQTQTEESGVLEDSDSRPLRRTSTSFHDEVIGAYHQLLPDLPRVKVWSKKRAQALDARIRERTKDGKAADTLSYWRKLFTQVAESDFLCGHSAARDGREPFRADLEWLIRPDNFAKVIEGRYNARGGNGAAHVR